MTYEEYLDEVATLLTENHDLTESAAIKCVVRAQAADYFLPHDDNPELRTVANAVKDAEALFEQRVAAAAAAKGKPGRGKH